MESFGFLRNGKENPAGRPLLPGGLFDITGRLFDITDDLNIKQKDRTPAKLQASGHQIKRARDGTRTRGLDLGKVALHQLSHSRIRAGDGNRTHISSLEGWCSTTELHPQVILLLCVCP